MTTSYPGPAQRLLELLETLPTEERRELTAWLIERRPSPADRPHAIDLSWPPGGDSRMLRRLTSALAVGEDSQLVTIRLPTERHAELRAWCGEHGFTMAAVVRGLIERFLEQQQRLGAASERDG